jgi:hypothetical protein
MEMKKQLLILPIWLIISLLFMPIYICMELLARRKSECPEYYPYEWKEMALADELEN